MTAESPPGPGTAGAPPALGDWPTAASPAVLRDPVPVTLPRYMWINFLAWAHQDYEPNTIPWIDVLVSTVEIAVDGP